VVKISHVVLHGSAWLNLDGFAPASQRQELSAALPTNDTGEGGLMIFRSATISPSVPRRLAGKDTRAAILFGRSFERALAAYFLGEDAAEVAIRGIACSDALCGPIGQVCDEVFDLLAGGFGRLLVSPT